MRSSLLPLLLLACDEHPEVAPPAPPASGLEGAWSAEERCGENAGGAPVAIRYQLRVSGPTARLEADGYQTMLRVDGRVEPDGDGYLLRFERSDADTLFPESIAPGAVLLRLSRSGVGWRALPDQLWLACAPSLELQAEAGP